MYEANSILETVKKYIGQSELGLMFLICLLVILSYHFREKDSRDKKVFIWVILLSLLGLYNDVSMKILGKLTDSATFYRFLWAVPVILVTAYGVVNIFTKAKGAAAKITVAGVCVLMLAMMGNSYVNTDSLHYPGSMEKIPQDIKTICDIIEEHKTVENPVCMLDHAAQLMVRIEEPSIVWAVGRQPYLHFQQYGYDNGSRKYRYSENLLKVADSGMQVEKKKLRKALKKKNVEFMVIKKEYNMDSYLKKVGLNPVGESDNYIIYQYINEDKEQ